MNSYRVLFLPHKREITVPEGESLIRTALEAGVHVNASCGGEGVCGKCRIMIEEGEVGGGISEQLSKEDLEKGYRLACTATIKNDLTVRIPVESTVDHSVLNKQYTPRKTARIKQMNFDELKEKGLFSPPVEKVYLELPTPTATDNLSDVTRLVSFLKLNHNEHGLQLTLPVIRKIPGVLRKDDFKVTATLARPVIDGSKTRIINIESGDTTARNHAVAMDIGTTTIYGQLIDLITGEVVAEHGSFNGQISYGEDVISRIVYAEKGEGLTRLQEVVIATVNSILAKIIRKGKIDPAEVSSITLAGNTTMTQILLGIDPSPIRRAPYVPASTLYPPLRASDLGMDFPEHVTALFYPQVSSYVGGDIVAGIMGAGVYRTEKLTLYMDIGTNAEIVVGNREWLACAACSAGPAFEGGGIKFGMRAAKGAIEDFSIDPVTLEPMVLTIGSVRPKGICGSGLIIMVAVFFETGIIDNRGKFNRDLVTPRIRESDNIWEYVVSWSHETQIDRDLVITETDIDNLIRAKGAMYSGVMTLLAEVGLSIGDLDQIILAGGFGSYVDLEKAMTIGLLPETDTDKVTFVGNGSLMGARMSSLTNRIRKDVTEVTKMMTNFELSETPSFMDNYIAALFLPHTDLTLFPRLSERLASRRSTE